MTWTAPRTWEVSESVNADMLNEQIRDNLLALKSPPSDNYECNEASDYTTINTSFEDVDATNLSLEITTAGDAVMVHFHGNMYHSVPTNSNFDVTVDGTRIGGDDGLARTRPDVSGVNGLTAVSFTALVTELTAGTHTFRLQWKTASGTATLLAGAGTAGGCDVHPQFWVREVS